MSPSVQDHSYSHLLRPLEVDGVEYKYYDLTALNDARYVKLPYSIRILVESAVRNCDEFQVKKSDIEKILSWEKTQNDETEIPFKPARVLLQDLTGVPVIVDFAAMRDAFKLLGGDPAIVNPLCPTDLVIDHSVQVDFSRAVLKSEDLNDLSPRLVKSSPPSGAIKSKPLCSDCVYKGTCSFIQSLAAVSKGEIPLRNLRHNFETSLVQEAQQSRQRLWYQPDAFPKKLRYEKCPFHQQKSFGADSFTRNQELEFERNRERFQFLRWGAKALKNVTIVPPGSGIVHQVNLEYLARVVFSSQDENILYPDSLVGADSHTTMINGLGILGWGVGGIEAEAVMLGQATSMVLPQVVGYKLLGKLPSLATSTDVVLTITKHLRQEGVVGKFVEFFGPGVSQLSIADRATIANMAPEYGATVGFFPVDDKALKYLVQTGRPEKKIRYIEAYLKAVGMFRKNFEDPSEDPVFTKVLELDLSTITASTSGPKRPQDKVPVSEMKSDFAACLEAKVGFKGYGLPPEKLSTKASLVFEEREYVLSHGSVVIAAITSCTNTSNPSVMLGAGLLAKKAVERGLSVAPYIKTSMSPGSGVVTYYLRESGVNVYLEKLGFDVVGYGCMTCIGNSGPLPDPVVEAIEKNDLIAASVLSGNRNFEGRVHPNTRANYLASPLLVVAYALAGTVAIDFESEPLGRDSSGNGVFLRDIWPSRSEIEQVETQFVIPAMFQEVYAKVTNGNERWNALEVSGDSLFYSWDVQSTYIKAPPFFDGMTQQLPKLEPIANARVLLNLGDSVTTDHISPAGSISRTSPAAKFLQEADVQPRDFNSYGARRGHDEVMARGTFANTRLVNKFCSKPGSRTLHIPSGEEMSVFDAASRYIQEGTPLILLVGKEYGTGSSRDWAAKGPRLLGVRAVIAESYERIHRSNLIGIGIIPLQYMPGENAESLGLTGKEVYTVDIPSDIAPKHTTSVRTSDGKCFNVIMRFDTEVELQYFLHGGILQFTLRRLLQKQTHP